MALMKELHQDLKGLDHPDIDPLTLQKLSDGIDELLFGDDPHTRKHETVEADGFTSHKNARFICIGNFSWACGDTINEVLDRHPDSKGCIVYLLDPPRPVWCNKHGLPFWYLPEGCDREDAQFLPVFDNRYAKDKKRIKLIDSEPTMDTGRTTVCEQEAE